MSSLQVLISFYDLVANLVIFDFFAPSAHMHSAVCHCTSGKAFLRCRSLPLFCLLFLFPGWLMLFVGHDKARLPSFRHDQTLQSESTVKQILRQKVCTSAYYATRFFVSAFSHLCNASPKPLILVYTAVRKPLPSTATAHIIIGQKAKADSEEPWKFALPLPRCLLCRPNIVPLCL